MGRRVGGGARDGRQPRLPSLSRGERADGRAGSCVGGGLIGGSATLKELGRKRGIRASSSSSAMPAPPPAPPLHACPTPPCWHAPLSRRAGPAVAELEIEGPLPRNLPRAPRHNTPRRVTSRRPAPPRRLRPQGSPLAVACEHTSCAVEWGYARPRMGVVSKGLLQSHPDRRWTASWSARGT